MASFPCVHHIEIGVTDGPKVVNILRNNFTFDVVAARNSNVARQWLLKKHDIRYLVTCMKSAPKEQIQKDDYVIDWMDVPNMTRWDYKEERQRKDSAFNICLQVDNMDKALERLGTYGVRPFKGLKIVSDSQGSVKVCTVKSCVGDVYHTLVEKNKHRYSGAFLPEFKPLQCSCDSTKDLFWENLEKRGNNESACALCDSNNSNSNSNSNTTCDRVTASSSRQGDSGSDSSTLHSGNCDSASTCFDHVAFSVEMGKSPEVIDWYEKCFGMKRFLINNEDDDDKGLVLSTDDVGLRLRAMEYWKCAETGIAGPEVDKSSGVEGNRLSFVIAEGLPSIPGCNAVNQIESWLSQHGGPGIQHIALSTGDIKATVGALKQSGARFAQAPPQAYYSQDGRLPEIEKAGEDAELLQKHGILIDIEANRIGDADEDGGASGQERYLLQIFTEPVLPKDPFFMEMIQRVGATGFGSGNVAALYRSVQASILRKAQEAA